MQMRRVILLCENGEGFAKRENNNLRSRLLTCPLTRPLMRLRLRAIDSAECRIINFDDTSLGSRRMVDLKMRGEKDPGEVA
jgi:hypothetical protein